VLTDEPSDRSCVAPPGDAIDTETLKKPIIAFVFSNKGLMANLTLEGSKITKIDK